MVKVKRSESLPPNFEELPVVLKREIEEQIYRRQLKWCHGYCPGDPRLRSMGADGVPVSGQFGKAVEDPPRVKEILVDGDGDTVIEEDG